ncbi:MAG TPA: ectoine synthase [Candidatus Limnocylindria bacterium]|jgi:L-ectoine synthase|nr:ectoine synthase [Candidatus Limnocylindria bacterium]
MIIRSLDDVIGTERDVAGDGWRSRRILRRDDGMGFSLHDTIVEAGAELEMEYRHHLEACYCLEGEAEIEELTTGERHAIGPGVLYALNEHDRHVIRVTETLRLVCVFNPPLAGAETHDATGAFPASE